MKVRVYYLHEDGQTCVVDQAKMNDKREFLVSFTCCPDPIIVTEKQWDENVRVRYFTD